MSNKDKTVSFLRLSPKGNSELLDKARIIAVFVEVGNAYGLMVQDEAYMTIEERDALIQAATELPTRETT